MIEEMKQKEEEKEKDKEDLRESIRTCTDFEDKLNEICEHLKKIIGATGVYVSSYEYKRIGMKIMIFCMGNIFLKKRV